MYFCLENLPGLSSFSLKKQDRNPHAVFSFLSFGDAFDYLMRHLDLKGKKILIPGFYCEETIEKYQKAMDVHFCRMDCDKMEVDYADFVAKLELVKPDIVLIYNFIGKNSILYERKDWLGKIDENTVLISDMAHSLPANHHIVFLNKNHFYIDSIRKCAPFMVAHLIAPSGFTVDMKLIENINCYKIKTRLIFALKNLLSYLSYIFKSNSIGKWSDLVFLWHNKHIGHPKKPTAAFFWDKFLYSHLKSRKFVEYRDELYGIYEKKVSESLPDFVKRFDIPKNEWKNMNYYFISVPADKSHSLVKFCVKKDVPVFQLWDLKNIHGLPVVLKEFSKSLVFLPFTNRTRKKEAEKACEIIKEFFNINH